MANPTRDAMKAESAKFPDSVAPDVVRDLIAAESRGDDAAAMRLEVTLAGVLGYFVDDDE